MTKNRTDETARESDAKGGDQERIAKVLARAGLCSRREAEEWVVAGRVTLNGTVLTTPAVTVGPGDQVMVDGRPLPTRERTRLWLFHKPRGLVTTTSDPEGRPTVFSVLPDDMPRVITVGRLDINTEGLLLLTNDGGLARVLELPSTGWLRRYRVRAHGEIDQASLDELKEGVSIDGVDYGPIEASIDRVQGSNVWLVVGLREGKNREVKRVLGSLGLSVNRLIRISFGPFQLADLEEGEIREIRGRVLRDQLGKRLVSESGADFDAPIVHHMHGGDEAEEAPKRRIKAFEAPEDKGERAPRAKGREPRTKMEFIGTGERRREDGGERGERGFRSEGFRGRGGEGGRSTGFRDRPDGGKGGKYRSEGFRDRGGEGSRRSEGFRDRPTGERSGGYRDRPGADERPRGEGRDTRPARGEGRDTRPPRGEGRDSRPPRRDDRAPEGKGGRFRSEGFRDRGGEGSSRSEGFRDRGGEGSRRSEGFRDRPEGGQRSEGFRDRGEGGHRSEGFRGRPDGAPGRSGGFRDRPEGSAPSRPRSGGFRDRPEGGASSEGRSGGFKPRSDDASFGPRGPRGMNPGGRKGPREAGERDGERRGPPKGGSKGGPKGPPKGGPKGGFKGGPRGAGPKGDRGGRGGPRGGRS